jgi:hypothetical protein
MRKWLARRLADIGPNRDAHWAMCILAAFEVLGYIRSKD